MMEEPKKREPLRWKPWSGTWWAERRERKIDVQRLQRRSEVLSDILAGREPFFYPEEKPEFEALFNELGRHKGTLTFEEALRQHRDGLQDRVKRLKGGR